MISWRTVKNMFSVGKSKPEPEMSSGYRTRNNFDGEKYSGGLNYPTSYNVDRQKMIARSIRAYEESMQARAAVNRLNESVINTGLALESTPESSILGLSNEQRKEISNKIESRFNLWANSKSCDISGNNTLGQIERIQFNNQLVKGDYFILLNYSDDQNLLNPLQLKIITPHRVSTPRGTDAIRKAESMGNRIIEGIEIDDNDAEVAYHIKTKKPRSFVSEWVRIPKIGEKTGRVMMIHGNKQRFGNEVRGIPALSNIAHELEKITDYSLLELTSAVANASIAAVVKPGENGPATNPMPGNTFVPPNLVKGIDGWDQDASISANLDNGYTNVGKTVLKNTGGLLVSSLNAGEDLVSYDTKRPNVNFEAFVDSMTKYLSASLSIPIEILNMQFGSNFSASRASLKLYWQSLAVWRDEFVSDCMTPVYNAWLLGEVGTGRMVLRGYEDPQLRPAWQSAKWIGVPSPSIDPFKEERAAELRVKNGFTTHEQEAQRRHRSSFDSNVDRLVSENERLARANEPLVEQQKGVA